MVQIHIECDKGETRRDVYEAVATWLFEFIIDETHDAYMEALKQGYKQGHKDGMTEAVTTITE